MDLTHLQGADPNMLLGIANMKLRHECGNLDELVHILDMNEEELTEAMDSIGYHYDPITNQFKPV